jgi:16S rRNA (cytosine1402-N4)-methyltransferase
MELPFHHIPVLSQEIVMGLNIVSGGWYIDATTGGGGHSELILQAGLDVRLVAVDRDTIALDAARVRLADYGDRVQFWHGNYADYQPGQLFDGVIADLGVSSVQLDLPERGFSFRHEAALDMRMDRSQNVSAADLVNHTSEVELARIIFTYGEERLSRQIARDIVDRTSIHDRWCRAQGIPLWADSPSYADISSSEDCGESRIEFSGNFPQSCTDLAQAGRKNWDY